MAVNPYRHKMISLSLYLGYAKSGEFWREQILSAASKENKSINKFVLDLIKNYLEKQNS
jgi:hypothetical protein